MRQRLKTSNTDTAVIVSNNKDIVTSFLYACARQPDMSIHELRVLLRVMEFCQRELKGIRLKDNLRQIYGDDLAVKLTMPITDAFFSDYKPSEVEKILLRLQGRTFQYRYKSGKGMVWCSCNYIIDPEVQYGKGTMSFCVSKKFWSIMLDLTMGFRCFELDKALALPTPNAIQFYMLLSGQNRPCQLSVDDFRKWLGIEDGKYRDKDGNNRIDNIEQRVIRPIKDALDNICPYSFTYEKVKENPDNPRSKVVGFRFFPHYQPRLRDPLLEKSKLITMLSPSFVLDKDVCKLLTGRAGFSWSELSPNKGLLVEAQEKLPDLPEVISELISKSYGKENPKGYILSGIKGKLKDCKGEK